MCGMMRRPVMLVMMLSSISLAAYCMAWPAMDDASTENKTFRDGHVLLSLPGAKDYITTAMASDDEASTELIEVTRTLGQGDWLRFQELSLQLVSVNENERDNLLDDSVELYVRLPEEAKILRVAELYFEQLGLYEIFVRRAVPSDATALAMATIRVRYRPFYIPRYRLTPTQLPPAKWPEKLRPPAPPQLPTKHRELLSITRWLRVGNDLRFRDLQMRLARVYENNPNNQRDDSVRLIVRTPIRSRDFHIVEYHSEFLEDYEIAVIEVEPSGRPGYGKARIQVRYWRR